MICLISPAKTFAKKVLRPTELAPRFKTESLEIAEQALRLDEPTLAKQLKINPKMATDARRDWLQFASEESPTGAALLMYSGMVYKKLDAKSFDEEDWRFAEDCLRMCSFTYGLLTPKTAIRPYRMEGTLRLDDGVSVFDYWKDKLTPVLLDEAKARGGTLINLASDEMQRLFHWSELKSALRIINIIFMLRKSDGSLKTIVVYCKMARGAMMHEIIKRQIQDPEELKSLTPEGFVYAPEYSTDSDWYYLLDM